MGTILKPMTKWINKNKGVLNEEEIMLQVELKLKELLGLNAKEPEENVDAGRELLNILQKVGQKESQSAISPSSSYQNNDQQPQPPMVNVPVPQHLHNQIPFLQEHTLLSHFTISLFSILCRLCLHNSCLIILHMLVHITNNPLTLKAFRSPRLTRKSCYLF